MVERRRERSTTDLVAPRLFVAHAPEDTAFVEGFLLPALALPAAEVLVSSRLTPGEALVDELARGALSTVTILILSPAFFECPWTLLAEQLAQHHDAESPDAAVVPVILATCDVPLVSRFRVSLDFRDPNRKQWEAHIARLRQRLAAAPAAAPAEAGSAPAAVSCPYPGMRPFTAEEVARFHGRKAEIGDLLARLRAGERELYVIGPSGSGKSSLVFAGLVPSLRHGSAAGGAFVVRAMRPGVDPIAALSFALSAPPDTSGAAPGSAVEALLAQHPGGDRALLVVDQLEELFTVAAPASRAAFFAAVRELRAEPRLALLFTLRADFYGALMDCPWWADLGGCLSRLDIGPLRGAALRAAIEEPAAAAHLFFEPALLERLLHDAADEPGTLPLLQETLVVLWHQRAHNLLRLADYLAIGNGAHTGLAVTLARRADSALRALDPPRRLIARRIFLRLVQFGSGRADTRRQEPRAALLTAAAHPAEVDAVLAYLVEHRLITASEAIGPGAVFDLSHEILLSAWPTLREWIFAQRVDEQRRRALETRADEWVTGGRGASGLLDTAQLAELDRWLADTAAARGGPGGASAEQRQPPPREEEQVSRSLSPNALALVARSRRRRLVLRWLAGSAFVLMAMTLLVIATLWTIARQSASIADLRGTVATEQRQLAYTRFIRLRQEEAGRLLLEEERPLQALPYLVAARRRAGDTPALRMLFAAARRDAPIGPPLAHGRAVTGVQLSPDGTRALTTSDDHTTRLWNAATGQQLATMEHGRWKAAAALPPGDQQLLATSPDPAAPPWDATIGQLIARLLMHEDEVLAAAISPDGKQIVTGGDSAAHLWDVTTGEPRGQPMSHRGHVVAVAFSPDGRLVATASDDATARLWDAATGEPCSLPLEHQRPVRALAFNRDGTRLATASDDGIALLWDTSHRVPSRPAARPLRSRPPATIPGATLSPHAMSMISFVDDSTVQLLSFASGRRRGHLLPHRKAGVAASFSPDGKRLFTAPDDRTVRVWSAITTTPLTPPLRHDAAVRAAGFSPDGKLLVTASDDKTARIWDARNGQLLARPFRHESAVIRAAFSTDGKRVVTTSADGAVRLWEIPLDGGDLEEWMQVARRSPYRLHRGVLVLREPEEREPEEEAEAMMAEDKEELEEENR